MHKDTPTQLDQSYETTFPQRAMYFQHLAHPTDTSFDLAFAFRFEGDTDFRRLSAATAAVLNASPGLNTHFTDSHGEVRAVVSEGSVLVEDLIVPAGTADDEDRWVKAATERAVESGPVPPSAPTQLTARLYRGTHAIYLTLVCGHIVGDAYSFYQIMDRISALYAADKLEWDGLLDNCGEHPGSVPPARTFESPKRAYYELLSGVETFENPPLAARRLEGRIQGSRHRRTITGTTAEQIRLSAAVETFGAATVFFAAYAAVLHRLNPNDQVVIGVPLANRAGYRSKQATGFFVNTLPLPVSIDSQTTWWQLCEHIKRGIRLLQQNQGVDLFGEDSDLLGRTSHLRPVDNAVTFYKQGLVLNLPGCSVTSLPLEREAMTYPLSLNVADDGTTYEVDLSVAEHLHMAAPEELLFASLDRIVSHPNTSVVSGSVFTTEETPPSTRAPRPGPYRTPVDMVEGSAVLHPTRTAIRRGAASLNYRDLSGRIRAAAAGLDNMSASKHVVVKIPKSIDAIVAMLAIMATGRIYVPVDPEAPAKREQLILDRIESVQGHPATVISDQPSGATGGGEIRLTDVMQPTSHDSHRSPLAPAHPDDTAYVIFTSGSTGEPKGVCVTHRNVMELLSSTVDLMDLNASDTWPLFHSLAFDFSIWEIFGPLCTGATLAIPTPGQIREPDQFVQFLEHEKITVLNQTPSAFRRLSLALTDEGNLNAVRLVVFGGEALHPADLQSWTARTAGQARMVNMYGITETTVHVTAKEITQAEIDFEHRSVIGTPLNHLETMVVDRYGRLCRDGIAGELLVTGTGVSSGYLGRPNLTAERFLPVRTAMATTTAYRTGDTAYSLPDGSLVYVGRIDQQVQLRGHRIELPEVEAALTACVDVGSAVVRLTEPEGKEPFLICWYTSTRPAAADTAGLRDDLAKRVPPYMIPARLIHVDRIPVTQNGKPDVERLALTPEPAVTEPLGAPATVQNHTDVESGIIRIWEDVLGTGRIGPADRFFEVGGTSMHVMQIHARLQQQFEVADLNLVDLFEYSTPRELADFLTEKLSTSSASVHQAI